MQKGLSIPYPSIGLHAIQTVSDEHNPDGSKGLFLQLELPDPAASQEIDDDEPETIELTLIPARPEETISTNDSSPPPKTPIQNMYEALTACSNLNPSPNLDDADDDEDPWANDRIVLESEAEQQGIAGLPGVLRGRTDGALPAPFPGSGGWITAENVGEYFDDDGNWLGREDDDAAGDALGDGAGRVRSRGEFDAADTSADPETTEDGDREGDGKRRRPDTEI